MTRERKRRQYESGSVYQACSAAAGCPALVEGPVSETSGKPTRVRPKHKCKGRWMGTFEVGSTKSGGRRRKTVTGKTEAEVKNRIDQKKRELGAGPEDVGERTTVKTWADTWLNIAVLNNRPNTHTADMAGVRWIIEAIGHKRLDQLRPADVRSVHRAIESAGRSSSTAARYHGTLIRMLKAASIEGHRVPPNVFLIDTPEAAVTDRTDIALAECLAILQVVATLPHGSRWLFALMQGPRQGEALGLTWDQLTDDSVTYAWQLQPLPYRIKRDRSSGFRVPRGYEARQLVGQMHLVRPKSKAGWRVAPLAEPVALALAAWKASAPASPHGLVWPALDGSPADENQDRKEWRAIQGTAMVGHPSGRYYTVHEARHATGTLLKAIGASESVRLAMMGHSSIASANIYDHANELEGMRSALGKLSGVLQLG